MHAPVRIDANPFSGEPLADDGLGRGSYWLPTLIDGVDPSAPIAQEEVFGPVLVTMPFTEEEEAVSLANGTDYGLAAYLWTNDLKRAHRVASALEAGWIGVNGFPPMPPNAPFGGYKESGFGREGGMHGLHAYVRLEDR